MKSGYFNGLLVPTGEPILLTTFNYDTILDLDLADKIKHHPTTVSEYVTHPRYKLFKLHGSTNWGRRIHFDRVNWTNVQRNDEWGVARYLVDLAASLAVSNEYLLSRKRPVQSDGGEHYFPAIAVPIASKNEFECPTEQIDMLKRHLPQVTKIIIIGWRGADVHFVRLLATGIRPSCRCLVVSPEGRDETIRNLETSGVKCDFVQFPGGFTQLVEGRTVDEFLANPKS